MCGIRPYRTQVQGSSPKVFFMCQISWASYQNLSLVPLFLFQLHSTMVWMALSVLSDTLSPWVSYWTCKEPFLLHCNILLQVAPHPPEGVVTMPHGLNFQLHQEQAWQAKIGDKNLSIASPKPNNVPLYTIYDNLLYHNWWSFVLNYLNKDRCNTVWTPCSVVQQSLYLVKFPTSWQKPNGQALTPSQY